MTHPTPEEVNAQHEEKKIDRPETLLAAWIVFIGFLLMLGMCS